MSFNDPISDMIARVRNALRVRAKAVDCVNSRVCRGIAGVLKSEGYIDGFDVVEDARGGKLRLKLRYGPRGERVLNNLQRESKPGRRVYRGADDLPRPLQGLGIAIVSTSRGVLSDRQCRKDRVGGELLCVVD